MSATTQNTGVPQPFRGILATAIIIAISLGFIALFDFPYFSTWVSFLLICLIPTQIVVSVIWGCNHPAFAAPLRQPLKGIFLMLLTIVIGSVVALIHYRVVGGGINPPVPMLAMCIITSVIITFWAAIMWGGWPFTRLIKHPFIAGIVMLAAIYAINFVLFRLFFDYGFMRGAPVYVPELDPHGIFNAWGALVFYVTGTGAMFLMLNFDLWPLTLRPGIMRQPILGLVWTAIALALTAISYYLAVSVLGMDPVVFMVRVPIPFIFGTIVVLNMLENTLFAKFTQPLKGVLNTIASAVIGTALAWMYSVLAPHVTGALKPGPPGYNYEIWLASALLAVTFPFLIFYAEFFKMWPLSVESRHHDRAAGEVRAAVR